MGRVTAKLKVSIYVEKRRGKNDRAMAQRRRVFPKRNRILLRNETRPSTTHIGGTGRVKGREKGITAFQK